MKLRFHPAWVLFLLSPAIGELLSGSAPPAEFFQPIAFAMLSILYGGGTLLIREFVVGRRLGWPAILLIRLRIVLGRRLGIPTLDNPKPSPANTQ